YDHPEVILAVSQRHFNPPPTGPLVVPAAGGPGGGAPQTGPTQTKLFKSTDKGLTWHEITGGGLPRLFGRTYVAVAMNTDAQRMLMGLDQGAVVTLDGGATWSSWFNQSTDQIYHITVDNSYPYWVYGSQQDAGAIRTRSRGNQGAVTPLDWNPVPGWEWGTTIADPLNPNIVYASGSGILKITYASEQWTNVSPNLA